MSILGNHPLAFIDVMATMLPGFEIDCVTEVLPFFEDVDDDAMKETMESIQEYSVSG